ncbi:hypothetical protein HZQ90_09275 [Elizabethkingia anophelis]|nr:hypothetical protein [Elizabethkingia anophelis]
MRNHPFKSSRRNSLFAKITRLFSSSRYDMDNDSSIHDRSFTEMMEKERVNRREGRMEILAIVSLTFVVLAFIKSCI